MTDNFERAGAPGELRSNFTPGSTRWAVRRAQWSAMGIDWRDQEKPKIAIVNTSSKLSVCFAHLDDVAVRVAEAVRAAGAFRSRFVRRRQAISSPVLGGRRAT